MSTDNQPLILVLSNVDDPDSACLRACPISASTLPTDLTEQAKQAEVILHWIGSTRSVAHHISRLPQDTLGSLPFRGPRQVPLP